MKDKLVIFVDIDHTICGTIDGDYENSVPWKDNIDKINKLYDDNNHITYYTSRGTVTGLDWYDLTFKQLNDWGCKFHDLRMGKPEYDLLICDKNKRIEEI